MNSQIFFIVLTFFLASCGSEVGKPSNGFNGEPTEVFQETMIEGKNLQIRTLSSAQIGDDAQWFLQLMHKGRKLGECQLIVIDSSNGESIIGFGEKNNPYCDGIIIDPSSTISDLKLEVEDQAIEYCVLSKGKKTCQEVSLN